MKKISLVLFSFLFIIFFSQCKKENFEAEKINIDSVVNNFSQPQLAEFLYQSGDIITKKDFPPVISQYDVLANKNKYLLIDIRKKENYIAGHIDGAYNISKDSLFWYLKNKLNPAGYDKVIIICYTGQIASYTATLLRFAGIGNAYALKYGMAGWNKKFRNSILKNLSSKYQTQLDTITYPKPENRDLPEIAQKPAFDVLFTRIDELLKLPAKEYMISADEVFTNPEQYFIISYLPPAKYKTGHIPTAIRYNTRSDLSLSKDLKTLPTDKKIVVYCNIGQHSASITAYLRLLGYDAYSLKFGLNSFMNGKAKNNGWFSDNGFLDLPVLEGPDRTTAKSGDVPTQQQVSTPVPAPVLNVNKDEGPGGGCE